MGQYSSKPLNVYIVHTPSALAQAYSCLFVQSSEKNRKIKGDLHFFVADNNTSSGVLHRRSNASYNSRELKFIGTTPVKGYPGSWDCSLQYLPHLGPDSEPIMSATALVDVKEESQQGMSYSEKVLIQLERKRVLMRSRGLIG
ncbi:hypothetical protein LT330_003839 [Penicillium expansum]|nr:hypothetical protein LT330_003839 [Penicillium expansum]